jgi:hypothetical protein
LDEKGFPLPTLIDPSEIKRIENTRSEKYLAMNDGNERGPAVPYDILVICDSAAYYSPHFGLPERSEADVAISRSLLNRFQSLNP